MQTIDIFNFKKYFKRNGDNNTARIGHVNSVIPLLVEESPVTSGLKPKFIGQIAILKSTAVWIATDEDTWTLLWD
jgi:hypothetical protein